MTIFSLITVPKIATLSLFVAVLLLPAEEQIVHQKDVGKDTCNPSSIANFLLHASEATRTAFISKFEGLTIEEKTKALIKEHCGTPSRVRPNRSRWTPDGGMSPYDTLPVLNDLRKYGGIQVPEMGDSQLIRKDTKEGYRDHLVRVYELLKQVNTGTPAIVAIWEYESYRNHASGEYNWRYGGGHLVTVVAIQSKLDLGASGFTFTYIDSSTGSREHGYIHVAQRPFLAGVQPMQKSL